ncbi:HNH endonuclease [Pasteurella sp. PK-2025]|uniref:HNH endonuclease n=1 Tax=unclassified Pasteurella TaxID=2621516 RepID=UPI003C723495
MQKTKRKDWHFLYSRKAWKQLRLDHLAKEPLCVFCMRDGKLTPATVVDHIKAHKGDLNLFFDENNLQSLCKLHHDSSKQKAEINKINEIGCDKNGFPIDPNHPFNKGRGG